MLTIIAIFAAGGLFLGGLYLTAWWNIPSDYRGAVAGIPERKLRIVSWSIDWNRAGTDAMVAELRPLQADFLLLQRVLRRDAYAIGVALGMQDGGEVQMYYSPANPDSTLEPGNAILARHPLYKGRSSPKPGQRGFGIFAESIVDGRRFLLASIELAGSSEAGTGGGSSTEEARSAELRAMLEAWERAGSPPLIAGGGFGNSSANPAHPLILGALTDALGQLHGDVAGVGQPESAERSDRILISAGWTAHDGGVIDSSHSSHGLIWVDVVGAGAE